MDTPAEVTTVEGLLEWAERLGLRLERRGISVEVITIRPAPDDVFELKAWKADYRALKRTYNGMWQAVLAALPDLGKEKSPPVRLLNTVAAQPNRQGIPPKQATLF